MAEDLYNPVNLRSYDTTRPPGSREVSPVQLISEISTGDWTPEAPRQPEIIDMFQGCLETAVREVVNDAETIYPATPPGLAVNKVKADGNLETGVGAGSYDLVDLLDEREKWAKKVDPVKDTQPTVEEQIKKVRTVVASTFGEEPSGESILKDINESVVKREANRGIRLTDFDRLITYSPLTGESPDDMREAKRAVVRDALVLMLASCSTAEARAILKAFKDGKLDLADPVTGKVSIPAYKFLRALDRASIAHSTGGRAFALNNPIQTYVRGSRNDATKRAACVGTLGASFRFDTSIGTSLDPSQKIEAWSDSTKTLYKGLPTLLDRLPEEIKNAAIAEVSMVPNPLKTMKERIGALKQLQTDVRAKVGLENKLQEIRKKLSDPAFRTKLGDGALIPVPISQILEYNLSPDHPARKEVIARRAINKIENQLNAAGLSANSTPFGEQWGALITKAKNELASGRIPDMLIVLDALGKCVVYSTDPTVKSDAEKAIQSILGISMMSRGAEGQTLIQKLTAQPAINSWGNDAYDFCITPGVVGGLEGKRDVSPLVRHAETLFKGYRNIKAGKKLEEDSQAGTINPDDNNTRLDAISNLGITGSNIFNNDYTLEGGPAVTDALKENAVAEILGLDPTSPDVQEIMKLTNPDHMLENERSRIHTLLSALHARKGTLATAAVVTGLSAIGSVFAPATLVFAAVTGAVGLRNFLQTVQRTGGFRNALRSIHDGLRDTVREMGRLATNRETRGWFWTFGLGSFTLRSIIPGYGTVFAALAEAGVAVGSEVAIDSRRRTLAERIAEARAFLNATTDITYQDAGGANQVANSVVIAEEYRKFMVKKQNLRQQLTAQARAAGRDLTPAEEASFTDAGMIASLRTPTSSNADRITAAVAELIEENKRVVGEANELYLRAARRSAAALAGSAAGGVAYMGMNLAHVARAQVNRLLRPPTPATPPAGSTTTGSPGTTPPTSSSGQPATPTTTFRGAPGEYNTAGEAMKAHIQGIKGASFRPDLWGSAGDAAWGEFAKANPDAMKILYSSAKTVNATPVLDMYSAGGFNPATGTFSNFDAIAGRDLGYLFTYWSPRAQVAIQNWPSSWASK